MSGVEPLLVPLITGVATAGAAAALSPRAPKPSTPTRMPDLNSPEVLEARRRRLADLSAQSGRESTILADDNAYSSSLLGE